MTQEVRLVIGFSIVVLGIVLSLIVNRYLRRRAEERRWRMPSFAIYGFVWITVLMGELALFVPAFYEFVFFENKMFLLTPFRLLLAIYVVLFNLLLIRLLRWHFLIRTRVKHRKLLILSSLVLWILVIGFILRIVAKNPNLIFDFQLFKISKVSITVFDLLSVLFIMSFTSIVLIFIKSYFEGLAKERKLDEGTAVALYKFTSYFLWTIAIVVSIEALGFDISIILAGSAALMVGLGMGVQQLFNDFVSGIILLTERNISVGDVVEVNGIVGRIVDIGFRTTTIVTRDNIRIIVPNSKFTSDNIINWTHSERDTRFSVKVGVAYGSDVEKVIRILLEVAEAHPDVKSEPKPFVRFEDFGDSALIFSLYFYTDKTFWVENIKSDLRIAIDKRFRAEGVTIPFPQHDVHLYVERGSSL